MPVGARRRHGSQCQRPLGQRETDEQKRGKMKISLGSWAFSFGPYTANPIPFDKTVKRLSEAGYDGIEICGFPPHVTHDQYPTKESRKKLVRFLQDNRL